MVGAQERIRVGADPVERDEAQVEQATPADDDVEPEREQHVDGDVECDPPDVTVVGDDGNEARRGHEQRQPGPPRDSAQPVLDRAEGAAALGAIVAVPGDPLVAADGRARRAFRRRSLDRSLERPGQLVVVATHVTPS